MVGLKNSRYLDNDMPVGIFGIPAVLFACRENHAKSAMDRQNDTNFAFSVLAGIELNLIICMIGYEKLHKRLHYLRMLFIMTWHWCAVYGCSNLVRRKVQCKNGAK